MNKNNSDVNRLMSQLTDFLELYLVKKAPALPDNVKETLVKIAPYLAIVGIVFSLPAFGALLGLGSFVNRLAYLGGYYYSPSYYLSMAAYLIGVVLMGLSIPGLFARKLSAWNLMFYSSLVNIVTNLIRFDLGSLIIGGLISLYFLFQVKQYYK